MLHGARQTTLSGYVISVLSWHLPALLLSLIYRRDQCHSWPLPFSKIGTKKCSWTHCPHQPDVNQRLRKQSQQWKLSAMQLRTQAEIGRAPICVLVWPSKANKLLRSSLSRVRVSTKSVYHPMAIQRNYMRTKDTAECQELHIRKSQGGWPSTRLDSKPFRQFRRKCDLPFIFQSPSILY